MHDEPNRPGYLGAMLDSERRLVLVPLDPEEPWAAFRRMRSWMKRRRVTAPASPGGEVVRLRDRENADGR